MGGCVVVPFTGLGETGRSGRQDKLSLGSLKTSCMSLLQNEPHSSLVCHLLDCLPCQLFHPFGEKAQGQKPQAFE